MTLRKEREVTYLMERYLDVAKEALKVASETIVYFLKADMRSAKSLMAKQKGLCAEIFHHRTLIWNKLGTGAFLPLIRVDLWAIVHHISGITDAAKACCEGFLLQQPRIPPEVVPKINQMNTAVFRFFPPVSDSVLQYLKGTDVLAAISGNMEALHKARKELDDLESALGYELVACALESGDKAVLDACIRRLTLVAVQMCRTFEQVQLITIKL